MKKGKGVSRGNLKLFGGVILLVLLLINLFLMDFSKQVDYQMKDMTVNHLADINSQSVKAVENEFNWVLSEVQLTAEYVSETPGLTEADRQRLYSQLKEKCGFANIRIVTADGALYSLERELLPTSIGGYVEGICRGEKGMTDVFPSSVTGEDVFAFYAPFMQDGRPQGGIAGIMLVNQMVDMTVTTGFNSGSYTYILTIDGTVVMQNSHEDSLYNGRNYFQFLNNQSYMKNFSVVELQKCMKQKASGLFEFRSGDEWRLAYYAPAQINDWYVMTEVSRDISDQNRENINVTALYLTIKIIIVFLGLAVLIIIWSEKTRAIIVKSKEEAELGKKKLELALRRTSNTTFEYVLKDDSFVFITVPEIQGSVFPPILKAISENAASLGLVSYEYLERWKTVFREVSKGREPEPLEFCGGTSFKEDTWFRLSMFLVWNNQGQVIEAIGIMEDISGERQIKSRFAQEEQYRAALLSEAVAMWSVDLIKQRVIACSVMGKDRMNGKSSFLYSSQFIHELCHYVHHEDHGKILNMVQVSTMLSDYYMGKGELKELFRVIFPGEQEYKWMMCTISLLTEPTTGNPVAFAYVRDVDEETRREMKLAYSSEREPLTGLYNRRIITEKVNLALDKEPTLSCLMMMDLDGFKKINDTYGHQEGDHILKSMAEILSKAFRADDLTARLGGDEFVVFLNRLPDKECAYARAEEVRRQVYNLTAGTEKHKISISIGLAFGPESGDTFSLLYQHADEALYMAKGRGKNQIAAYGEEEEITIMERPD